MTEEPNYCCDCNNYYDAQDCSKFRRGNGKYKHWHEIRENKIICEHFMSRVKEQKLEPTLVLKPKENNKDKRLFYEILLPLLVFIIPSGIAILVYLYN